MQVDGPEPKLDWSEEHGVPEHMKRASLDASEFVDKPIALKTLCIFMAVLAVVVIGLFVVQHFTGCSGDLCASSY